MDTCRDTQTVRFSQEALELFRDASGDRNPLHLSREYASKTAYGQQVVFGALGAVACLGRLADTAGRTITKIAADFHRPMFLDVDYTVRLSEQRESKAVRLQDGTVPVLTLSVQYGETHASSGYVGGQACVARREAAKFMLPDLAPGTEVTGAWATDGEKTGELCHRWSIDERNTPAVEAMLWSSYAVGMELPGKSALFFRVALEFETGPVADDAITYAQAGR